ncbi:hypothetical protein [Pseudophaeobacter sp.]|uniref:COG3904 family protein n=1 Tax=Pseudophaeobacter sp. TaxID=1971739 RepID=UPI003299CA92
MIRFFTAVSLALFPLSVLANERISQKFEIEGTRLIYDTEKINGEITERDIGALKRALRKHTEILEIQLNSSGGSVHAGTEMAGVVMKYRLDTYVGDECTSACVDVFLAGNRRHIAQGAKIGFHQRSWGAEAVQRYYRNWRERKNWDSPFEFGAWIYADTQIEIHEHLAYMISRGVEAGFAVESMKAESSEIWYPTQEELATAGVLREAVLPPLERPRVVAEPLSDRPQVVLQQKK